jgi:indole-3-glycerol phosphate synthase
MSTSSLYINRDIILAAKRQHMAERRETTPLEAVRALATQQRRPRYIFGTTHAENRVAIIGLVTRTPTYDPVSTALQFVSAGADAIAFFTDHTIYDDDLNDMLMVARGVSKTPVVAMNYLLDSEYSVVSTRAADASGVVLYAPILDDTTMRRAVSTAQRWKMTTLIQGTQTDALVRYAQQLSPHIICLGDLLTEDLEQSLRMLADIRPQLPHHTQILPMNILHDLDTVQMAIRAGVDALFVGESLLKTPQHARKLRQMTRRETQHNP